MQSVKTVGGSFGALGEIGVRRKSACLLKDTKEIAMPFEIAMAESIGKVHGKIKTIATAMTFLEKNIGGNVVTIAVGMVSKLVVEGAKVSRCGALADRGVTEESFLVESAVKEGTALKNNVGANSSGIGVKKGTRGEGDHVSGN
jgi:hypothetical protein